MRQFALLLILTTLAGCSKAKPEDKVVGTWFADMPMPPEMKNDPAMRQFLELTKDGFILQLNADHTYSLKSWSEKTGTWRLSNRLIKFDQTQIKSSLLLFADLDDFGRKTASDGRTYSAVLSPDEKKIKLLMGKFGDVEFHR